MSLPTTALHVRDASGLIMEQAIDMVVQQIVDAVDPEKIVLFGSYAAGQPRPDSDVDLLIILDTHVPELAMAGQIARAIDYRFGLDLVVRTPSTIQTRLALGDPFIREIVERGKTLYQRARGCMGRQSRGRR